jgi:hypothetical protein
LNPLQKNYIKKMEEIGIRRKKFVKWLTGLWFNIIARW